jgi:hypothetical protein
MRLTAPRLDGHAREGRTMDGCPDEWELKQVGLSDLDRRAACTDAPVVWSLLRPKGEPRNYGWTRCSMACMASST